eukprot:TRINITY_DN1667_c0_g1_i4.p1 TRINITY_DN1667_c0_g1~~TRINITY_DN1667_c0_g1_i4.p1  ORF type:complete len:226 (+),score=36.23 TRINITY_DN1667_c0_g1_i4:340-1017(+)
MDVQNSTTTTTTMTPFAENSVVIDMNRKDNVTIDEPTTPQNMLLVMPNGKYFLGLAPKEDSLIDMAPGGEMNEREEEEDAVNRRLLEAYGQSLYNSPTQWDFEIGIHTSGLPYRPNELGYIRRKKFFISLLFGNMIYSILLIILEHSLSPLTLMLCIVLISDMVGVYAVSKGRLRLLSAFILVDCATIVCQSVLSFSPLFVLRLLVVLIAFRVRNEMVALQTLRI